MADGDSATRTVPADVLESACSRALVNAGLALSSADLVARVLVDADCRGHHSHGVELLPTYLTRLAEGGIDANAVPEWVGSTEGVCSTVEAHGGPGQVAMQWGVEQAVRAAKRHGAGVVAVKGNNHVGMMAAYRAPFLEHDVTGILLNISGPSVAPPGANRASLGNGAFCVVSAAPGAPPFIVDFATGIVALGKIRHLGHMGMQVPEGWLLDSTGHPSTDPADLDLGGSVPVFGGYKGLCVALVIEVLAGVLGGDTISPRVRKQRQQPDQHMRCSQLVIALNNSAFGASDRASLLNELHTAVRDAYDVPPAVYYPEQLERGKEEAATAMGIATPAAVWEAISL